MSADFILMCVWSSFLFKPETAYEMRISDWSSTCALPISRAAIHRKTSRHAGWLPCQPASVVGRRPPGRSAPDDGQGAYLDALPWRRLGGGVGLLEGAVRREARAAVVERSEEHTSELQSLMRTSYAVFWLKKKTNHKQQ